MREGLTVHDGWHVHAQRAARRGLGRASRERMGGWLARSDVSFDNEYLVNRAKYVLRYGKRRTYTAPDNSVYPSHRPTSCDSLTPSLQRQGLGETASIAPRARRLNAGILWRNAPLPRQRV